MSVIESRRAECEALTARQVQVLVIVTRYYDTRGAACPARHVARELNIHHEAVRTHFATLCRKGWLTGDHSPVLPRRPWLERVFLKPV